MTELSDRLITAIIESMGEQNRKTIHLEAAGKISHDTAVREIFERKCIIRGIAAAVNAVMVGEALTTSAQVKHNPK